jgi:hypothetical protein
MIWKYRIPHVWHSPEERTVWEDVYLIPADGSTQGKSIWFTLNALTVVPAGLGSDLPDSTEEIRKFHLRILRDDDFYLTSTEDMVAGTENFNEKELLEWTARFIKARFGDPDPILVAGTEDEFAGSNPHASEVGRITEALESGVPEQDVINYRRRISTQPGGRLLMAYLLDADVFIRAKNLR